MSNVLIPCGGRWVGLILQMKQAMRQIPQLRDARLFVADRDASNPAGLYADGSFVVPEVKHPHYRETILALCRRHNVGIVVPHLDLDLDSLVPHKQRFADAGVALIAPSLELLELFRDKQRFEEFAREESLCYPRSYSPDVLCEQLFPLFVKQRRGSGSSGAGVCRSLAEARFALERRSDLLFQELVEAVEVSVDAYVSASGRCTVRVPRVRMRVLGGEAVHSRTIRDAGVAQLADRTLAALAQRGYSGPLNVQIFMSPCPKLIEANARLGSGSVLANRATEGRLFHNLLVEACGGIAEGEPDDYREGLCLTRYWGEIIHEEGGSSQYFPAETPCER